MEQELIVRHRRWDENKNKKDIISRQCSYEKQNNISNITKEYSIIKSLIDSGNDQAVISKLDEYKSHGNILKILDYDPSVNNDNFLNIYSVNYRIINIIIKKKRYILFHHMLNFFPNTLLKTSVAHDLILSNDVEFFKILEKYRNIAYKCLYYFCLSFPYNGYSFLKNTIKKKCIKKLLKNIYIGDTEEEIYHYENKKIIEGVNVMYYCIINNSNEIIEIVYSIMKNIIRDNFEIWDNAKITLSQLYLKRIPISMSTFELLNSHEYFNEQKVSIQDFKWTVRKHFLIFTKSYETEILSNSFINDKYYNIFKVFTMLKREIIVFI